MDGYIRNHGTCGVCGKVNFMTKAAARDAIRRMSKNYGRTDYRGHPLRPYTSCDGTAFHVGHSYTPGRANLNDPQLRWIN